MPTKPKKKTASPARRRQRIAELVSEGETVETIAEQLGTTPAIVRRTLRDLRRRAAERDPWAEPDACHAAFIEAAEAALQKVRKAQQGSDDKSTAHLNLVKLEWAMLVRFIEMTAALAATDPTDATHNEATNDENILTYSNEELLRRARELGIDTSPFERALRAEPGDLDQAA